MTHRIRIAAATLLATAFSIAPLVQAHWAAKERERSVGAAHVDGSVDLVVDLRDNADRTVQEEIARIAGAPLVPNSVMARSNRLFRVVVPGADADRIVATLRSHPSVEAAEPEHRISIAPMSSLAGPDLVRQSEIRTSFASSTRPDDPRYDEQWNFRMVNAEKAWETTRGKGVVVAVIDTGVSGVDSRKGKACRDFNTTSFVPGYDFVNDDDQPYDDHAHGTHVAGTIAEATNNGEGVAGLAYEATIMPLKVLSASGSGGSADIADAIRWAADMGAHVINMSLGSSFPDSVIHNACKYARKKGVVIVCAAGNSGRQGVGYPAAFAECFAVSAVGPTGKLAEYSSWGKQVAIAAPGGDYVSSGNRADGILQNTNLGPSLGGHGDDYYSFQGTSMATPHVAAVAALVISTGVTDAGKVEEILRQSATPKGDAKKFGAGLLDAAKAVSMGVRSAAGIDSDNEPQWRAVPNRGNPAAEDSDHNVAFATCSASASRWDTPGVVLPLVALFGMMMVPAWMRRNGYAARATASAFGFGALVPLVACTVAHGSFVAAAVVSSVLVPGLLAAWLWNHRAVRLSSAWAAGQLVALALAFHQGLAPLGPVTDTPAGRNWLVLQMAALALVAVGAALRSRWVANAHRSS